VELWQQRLPLAALMTDSRPKGRTRKALKDRIEKLASSKATQPEANRLRPFYDLVLLAEQLRPKKLRLMQRAELVAAVAALRKAGVAFPRAVQAELLDCAFDQYLEAGDFHKLLIAIAPWHQGHDQFDPENPMLCELGIDTTETLLKFKDYFTRCLVPMIMQGLPRSKQVQEFCKLVKDSLDTVDLVEMDAAVANTYRETTTAIAGLDAVINMPFDSSIETTVKSIDRRRRKTDKSILTTIATTINASPEYHKRFESLLQALPDMIQYGDRIQEHVSKLEKTLSVTAEDFGMLGRMCDDISKLDASTTANLIEDFRGEVLNAVLKLWATAKALSESGELNIEVAQAAQKCLADAVVAFALDNKVKFAQVAAVEVLTTYSAQARSENLAKAFRVEKVLTIDDGDDNFTAIAEDMQHCIAEASGITTPVETLNDITAHFVHIAELVAQHIQGNQVVGITLASKVMELWGAVGNRFPKEAMENVRQCIVVTIELAGLLQVTQEGQEDGDAAELEKSMVRIGVLTRRAELLITDAMSCDLEQTVNQLLDKAKTVAADGKTKHDSLIAKFLHATEDHMKEAQKKLFEIMLGTVGGNVWHAKVPNGVAWQGLVDEAQAKLMSIDFAAAEKAIDALTKFADSYGDLLQSSGGDGKNSTLDEAQKCINECVVRVAEGLLIHHISTECDKESLRKKIQTEIRKVRARSLREKEHLHPVMFRKTRDLL